MQQKSNRQTQINQELITNMNSVIGTIRTINASENETMQQIINLLAYKFLSQNAENNNDDDIGYELDEKYYYNNLLINKGDIIGTLKSGIEQITQNNKNIQASDVFYDLFDLFDFKRFNKNETWLSLINIVEKLCLNTTATINEIIIFIIKSISDDKVISTPKPTEEMIELITCNQTDINNLYDPFADDGVLLAEIGNKINVKNYYGQHPRIEKCINAKITLLTNNVNYKNIHIKNNDINEPLILEEKMDLCVTMPPFARIGIELNRNDKRFEKFMPKRQLELVYLLDMLYHLDEEGTIHIITTDGLLRTGGSDKKIIQYIVDEKLLTSVITLPGGLFNSTGVTTAIIRLDKKQNNQNIFFLDLRNAPSKQKSRKQIQILDLEKYIEILQNKKEVELISTYAKIEDIKENEYILAINRYIYKRKIDLIDIEQTLENIQKIKNQIKQVEDELNTKIDDL